MIKITDFLGVSILLLLAACGRLDVTENRYRDTRSAISAGAIERGWIPVFLPLSANEIIEQHNLDTNEVLLRFLMDQSDIGSIAKSCQRTERLTITFPRKGASHWWPESLTEKGANLQQRVNGHEYYHCNDGGFIVVERSGHEVFYWHLG